MVSSWLVKVVLGIALAGFLVIELGSPLIAKGQAESAATDIADEVALKIHPQSTKADLLRACDEQFATRSVEKVSCDVVGDEVVVRVRKIARSLVMKNVSATEGWYRPEVTVKADLE